LSSNTPNSPLTPNERSAADLSVTRLQAEVAAGEAELARLEQVYAADWAVLDKREPSIAYIVAYAFFLTGAFWVFLIPRNPLLMGSADVAILVVAILIFFATNRRSKQVAAAIEQLRLEHQRKLAVEEAKIAAGKRQLDELRRGLDLAVDG
jgi:hypothetical protein